MYMHHADNVHVSLVSEHSKHTTGVKHTNNLTVPLYVDVIPDHAFQQYICPLTCKSNIYVCNKHMLLSLDQQTSPCA